MPIFIRLAIFPESVHKVFLEYGRHGVQVLDEDDPQPLAEAVVVLVVAEAAAHAARPLVLHIEAGPRYVDLHEVPNVCKASVRYQIYPLLLLLIVDHTDEDTVELEGVENVEAVRHQS